jgi:DNA-binding transcriptional ArsR family regulator
MNGYLKMSGLLKALGHPVRLRILQELRQQEACVCHLEAVLRQRQAYISQQLMRLREAGLVEDRREGMTGSSSGSDRAVPTR